MRKLIILSVLMIMVKANSVANYYEQLTNLTITQKYIMLKIFNRAKVYNLQYTMTAIAFRESQFGKYMVNISDPSFGYFHNLIKSVVIRNNIKTVWGKSRAIEKLLFDFNYSFNEALSELNYWSNKYKNDAKRWSKMVSSYNAGNRYQNGQNYLLEIKKIIKSLRKLRLGLSSF